MSIVTLLEKTPNLVGVVCVWCFLFCDGGCLVGFVLGWSFLGGISHYISRFQKSVRRG